MQWEMIDAYHQRVKVPGGWILKAFEDVVHDRSASGRGMIGGWDHRIAICFIPDPHHEWILASEKG